MAEKTTTSPRAADFMTRHVQMVGPETTLGEVIAFLLKHEVSNAPVVEQQDGKNVLLGFISEQDCLEVLSNEAFYGSPAPPQTARTIMRIHPMCVTPDTEMFTLASIFATHGYRHLPVVENGSLVGIVSRRDILKAMDAHYRETVTANAERKFPPNWREIIRHRFIAGN